MLNGEKKRTLRGRRTALKNDPPSASYGLSHSAALGDFQCAGLTEGWTESNFSAPTHCNFHNLAGEAARRRGEGVIFDRFSSIFSRFLIFRDALPLPRRLSLLALGLQR